MRVDPGLAAAVRSRYPRTMPLRFVAALALSIALSDGLSAKESTKTGSKSGEGKGAPARTWKSLVDHMVKNGVHYATKAPSSRTLGFDSDIVNTRGLYLKAADAKDGSEHSFVVVYDLTDKKVVHPREIILGRIRVSEENAVKEIDTMRLRLSLSGDPIKGMHAAGVVGKVKQTPIAGDSKDAKEFLATERAFWLKEVDLKKLVR